MTTYTYECTEIETTKFCTFEASMVNLSSLIFTFKINEEKMTYSCIIRRNIG